MHFTTITYAYSVCFYLPVVTENCKNAVQKCRLSQLTGSVLSKKCILSHAATHVFSKKRGLSHAITSVFCKEWPLSHAIGNGFSIKQPLAHAIGNRFLTKCSLSHAISSVCSKKWCLSHLLKSLLVLMFGAFNEDFHYCLNEIPPELKFNIVLILPDTFQKRNNPRD